jgi:hypothetical protein
VKAKKILNEILVIAKWAMGKLFLNLIVENVEAPAVKPVSHVKSDTLTE